MKISIITITFNSAKTIQRALDSVQSQTYADIEHVIVDGASTDGTKELIETYAKAHKNVRWISEKWHIQCLKQRNRHGDRRCNRVLAFR